MEEIWRDILGYEGIYQVSNLGRVRSLDRYVDQLNRWGTIQRRLQKGRLLSPGVTHDSYQSVSLCRDGMTSYMSVHRLVAEAFIPNPDNLPQVNHKDENPCNNCVDNLEWCTSLYNNNYGNRKLKLSKALKGKMHSEEYKQRMSEVRSGEGNPMYGRAQSAETRAKISAAHKGRPKSPEAIAKMRESLKGNIPWNKGRHTKPIICLDADITFDSSASAAEWIGGITPSAIEYAAKHIACCRGHVFVYADNMPEDPQAHVQKCLEKHQKSKAAGASCRCIEDNLVFKFIGDAAKYYGITYSDVYNRLDNSKGIALPDSRIIHFERMSHEEIDKQSL